MLLLYDGPVFLFRYLCVSWLSRLDMLTSCGDLKANHAMMAMMIMVIMM